MLFTLTTNENVECLQSGQHQMISPSTQASMTGATSNVHGNPSTGGVGSLDGKLWPANSTTPSPKGFGGFGEHHGPSGNSGGHNAGHGAHNSHGSHGLHQAQLSQHHPVTTQQLGSGIGSLAGQHAPTGPAKPSPIIRDFIQTVDDREWQAALFNLLQSQTYNQVEVDLFELMCKVLDQNLFSQVDWARNSVFFKDLKVRSAS